MLERVFDLREEIALFLEEKNVSAEEFRDEEWITKLAFLTYHIALKQSQF